MVYGDGGISDHSFGNPVTFYGCSSPRRRPLAPSPPTAWRRISGRVYVATTDGILRSTDYGVTWRDAGPGLTAAPSRSMSSLALDPYDPSIVYAGTLGGGVFAITFVDEPVR